MNAEQCEHHLLISLEKYIILRLCSHSLSLHSIWLLAEASVFGYVSRIFIFINHVLVI